MRPSRSSSARVSGWSDPAFARVADVVYLVSGLVFPPNRQPSAEAGMRRAMSALRIAEPDLLGRAVQSPGDARDALLAELTVGETYFFRDEGQLDLLRTTILPDLLRTRGPEAPIRIWSAGCASGEEPYTLAMLLREAGWPRTARILGTDVARPRLEAARRARYTRWSLRGVSEARIERWFQRRASHYQLADEIRQSVRYSVLNLMTDEYPSPATATDEQDVVLCRNVLIYFTMDVVARIAARLLSSLAPDGWLLLGASDPPLSGLVPCETVMTPAGVIYRRADRVDAPARAERGSHDRLTAPPAVPARATWTATDFAAPAPRPPPSGTPANPPTSPPAAPRAEPVRQAGAHAIAPPDAARPDPVAPPPHAATGRAAYAIAYADADYPAAESLARTSVAEDPGSLPAWVTLVRAVANQGRLADADEQCVHALDAHPQSGELHYLHAMLLGLATEHQQSAGAARRALYLDRSLVMAHLQLGDALAHLGDTERSALAFDEVRRRLANVGDDELIPAADGIAASRLRQVAAARLHALSQGRDP